MLSKLPPCLFFPTLLNVLRVCFYFVYEALLLLPLTSSLSLTGPQATHHTFLSRPPRVPPLLLSFHDFPLLHLLYGRPHSSTFRPANVIVLAASSLRQIFLPCNIIIIIIIVSFFSSFLSFPVLQPNSVTSSFPSSSSL